MNVVISLHLNQSKTSINWALKLMNCTCKLLNMFVRSFIGSICSGFDSTALTSYLFGMTGSGIIFASTAF